MQTTVEFTEAELIDLMNQIAQLVAPIAFIRHKLLSANKSVIPPSSPAGPSAKSVIPPSSPAGPSAADPMPAATTSQTKAVEAEAAPEGRRSSRSGT